MTDEKLRPKEAARVEAAIAMSEGQGRRSGSSPLTPENLNQRLAGDSPMTASEVLAQQARGPQGDGVAPGNVRDLARGATPWEQLPVLAKLERLRIAFKRLDQALGRVDTHEQILGQLIEHKHDGNGEIVVRLRVRGQAMSPAPGDDPKAWL